MFFVIKDGKKNLLIYLFFGCFRRWCFFKICFIVCVVKMWNFWRKNINKKKMFLVIFWVVCVLLFFLFRKNWKGVGVYMFWVFIDVIFLLGWGGGVYRLILFLIMIIFIVYKI